MTVKEAVKYIISESKKDESLLTDTKRFWAYLSDLSPEYKEKGLNVIKRSLDSEFLELCFKSEDDLRHRVFRMKYRLENQGIADKWINFIIDSFFSPLGWKPVEDEEESSQPQQTQKQETQKNQTQKQQTQKQQTQPQQKQPQQTQKQQTQKQQTQKQQTQKQQTQKQQTQKQQTQKQQTQKQQTQSSNKRKNQNRIFIAIVAIFIASFIVFIVNNLREDYIEVKKDGYIEVTLNEKVFKQLGYDVEQGEKETRYIKEGKIVKKFDIPDTYTYFWKKYKITSIGRAFEGCSYLEDIIIPNTVMQIDNSAFEDCSSLTSITIPESVTEIGDFAFLKCTSLRSITIPNSVTKIGDKAFKGCSFLNNIKIPDSVADMGIAVFADCSSLTNVTIPNSLTNIRQWTFSNSSLNSIVIPNSVTKIREGAFYNCKLLKKVTIPNSVTHISEKAFAGCSSLENVIIPNSVTYFGYDCFEDVLHVEYHGKLIKFSAQPPWGAKSMN